MGLPVEVNNLMMGAVGGYQISRSLRFRSSASAYLNRTFGAGTSTQKGTISVWVKRGVLGNGSNFSYIFDGGAWQSGAEAPLVFNTSDQLTIYNWNGSSMDWQITTTAVYRDPSAWYHIVAAWDSTQATAANRVILYVNGIQQTALATANYPTQNANLRFNDAIAHAIGRWQYGTARYYDGYLAEVNFIDGQALTPSSFGETDSITGVWNPKKYSGTYGTNGFYLNFSDNSGATATTIGKDSSGNGNNWTPNNISVTAGTTYDSMIDSPTPYADGGTGRGNYAVLNPLTNGSYTTLSGGNLNSAGNTSVNNGNSRSSFAFTTGKWYAEFTVTGVNSTYPQYGIMQSSDAQSPNNGLPQAGYGSLSNSVAYGADGNKIITYTSSAYGSSYTTNDVIGIAIDADNGAVYFSKNGTFQNSGVPTSGSSKTGAALTWTGSSVELVIAIAEYNGSGSATNFGQRPFSYTPPSGYNALNTYNLPTPSIANGAQHFAATTYTGNNGTNNISSGSNNTTGTTFQPDLIWLKCRSSAEANTLVDSVRGNNLILISSPTGTGTPTGTAAERTGSYNNGRNNIAISSTGVQITNSSGLDDETNLTGRSYIGWMWKGGGTAVTNNSGTISSQVSANTSAGFSIVTYTGNGSVDLASATVGHGLGVAPNMIIVKNRSGATNNWNTYHSSIGNTGAVQLNLTGSTDTNQRYWNNTSPTSNVFSISTNGSGYTNANGINYVAYCFSAVRGFSSFGSYTGNGSTDGPFIYTGFRPRFILTKRTDNLSNWWIHDTSRDTYNAVGNILYPDLSNAEYAGSSSFGRDFLSNGFKIRTSDSSMNGNGATIIYAAFAENPFQNARAR